jgi:uncharacterized protein (DUF58 family)
MPFLLPFLLLLLAVALFTRVDAFFTLLYVLFGLVLLGRLWSRRALHAVTVRRVHNSRAFPGEEVEVRLEVANRSWLPVLWLRLHDSVPAALVQAGARGNRQAVSLGPYERVTLSYWLRSQRRGYYRLGPLTTRSGDLLGSAAYEAHPAGADDSSFIIVYPHVVPLRRLGLPSQSPFGIIPSRQRIFEDPSRPRGVRDYSPGDSLRQIDWKTSARLQSLQVRRFEPAIALATAIFLNLDPAAYPVPHHIVPPEMGIVVAASLAAHLAGQRQAVALVTNGLDPLALAPAPALPLRKGREHLMHVLDLLARLELAPEGSARGFIDLVVQQSPMLPWGSTAVLIIFTGIYGKINSLSDIQNKSNTTQRE